MVNNSNEVVRALGLFRSVIQGGEGWSSTCQEAYDRAIRSMEYEFIPQPGNTMDTPADARDAARYRWLRDSDNFPIDTDQRGCTSHWEELGELDTDQFDEWVDREMNNKEGD